MLATVLVDACPSASSVTIRREGNAEKPGAASGNVSANRPALPLKVVLPPLRARVQPARGETGGLAAPVVAS